MQTMQISLTDGLREFLEAQAVKNGFSSPSEYVHSLLADLQDRCVEKEALEAMLLEGLDSPRVVADAAFWAERRRKVLERKNDLEEKLREGFRSPLIEADEAFWRDMEQTFLAKHPELKTCNE